MYNPAKAKARQGLPVDTIMDGIAIAIQDKKVKDFVAKTEKWKNPEGNAINVTFEVIYNNMPYRFDKIFTYIDENGETIYNEKSDLGKYKGKYGSLPAIGDKIKVITNKDGYLRLKLD